jgi:hypothetical protein
VVVEADEPAAEAVLDVYHGRDGLWNPERGVIEMPEGWELLPSGDAFLTRRVKAAGEYWLVWRPRSRSVPHRRLLGLLAPSAAIEAARAEAEATLEVRSTRQAQGARYRARREDDYRQELTEAIVAFLDFAPEHAELAARIAADAAGRAGEVGSGRVGRTRKLSLDQRAELAARALIRHRHTSYEDRLETEVWDDEYLYRQIKADAQQDVDGFLRQHRERPEAS